MFSILDTWARVRSELGDKKEFVDVERTTARLRTEKFTQGKPEELEEKGPEPCSRRTSVSGEKRRWVHTGEGARGSNGQRMRSTETPDVVKFWVIPQDRNG